MSDLRLKEKKKSFFKSPLLYLGIIFVVVVMSLTVTYYAFLQPKLYNSQKYGFSFKYPKSWIEEDLSKAGLEKYLVARVKNENTKATFQVKTEEVEKPGAFNTEELLKKIDESMHKEFENFEKHSSRDVLVSSRKALEYVYSYSYKNESGETKKTQQKMIVLTKDKRLYYLIGQSPQDQFSKSERSFDQIINSFKIN